MMRARTITLVLVGGGLALGTAGIVGAVSSNRARERECQEARAQGRPDAPQICARASSYRSSGGYYGSSSSGYRGGSGGSWFFGRSSGATPAAFSSAGSVSRGGFGGSASSFSGGS